MTTQIPPVPDAQVWIDFDGTITQKDVLDELITRFAVDESWRDVEAAWQANRIGSYDCLRQEFALLRLDADGLAAFLRGIPIDPGAAGLFRLLCDRGIATTIVSDGIESFIRLILARAGIEPVPVRANRLEHAGDRMELLCPYREAACASRAAHCKCASIAALGAAEKRSIYVGDGRSDLCAARRADVVFAKGVLARELAAEGRRFLPFDTLDDVRQALAACWSPEAAAV